MQRSPIADPRPIPNANVSPSGVSSSGASPSGPLVSVIINNYNYGNYVAAAIDSALAQAYEPKEIIVVDDGSTDDSRDVIASYGSAVVAVFKKNGGQPSAYNAGIAASRGEIVCFLDSDDLWLPGKLEKTVKIMRSNPGVALAFHRMQKVTVDLAPISDPWPTRIWSGDISSKVGRSGGWWPCPASSALSFRKDALLRIGGLPESQRYLADAMLSDLAPFLGKVDGVGEVLALYRVHDRNYYMRDLQEAEQGKVIRSHLDLMEARVRILNENLARLGKKVRVRAEDSFHLQRFRNQLGEGPNRLGLAFLALRFQGESRFHVRLKTFLRLLIKGR